MVRGDVIVLTADSIALGGMDEDGIWRGLRLADEEAFRCRASLSDRDGDLGHAVREALLRSRLNMPREWADAHMSEGRYNDQLALAFGLSSRRNLYSGMRNFQVEWAASLVTLMPMRRRHGGSFEGFPSFMHDHEDIVVPFAADDADLGLAMRECLWRCR